MSDQEQEQSEGYSCGVCKADGLYNNGVCPQCDGQEEQRERACEPQMIDFSEPHILVDEGISGAIVCSSGTEEEALAWLQKEVPVVVGNWSWQKIENPTEDQKPIACKESEGAGRMHYLFEC